MSNDYAAELITKLGKAYRTKPADPKIIRAYQKADGDYLIDNAGIIVELVKEDFEKTYEPHITRPRKAKG
jgi:hypothetical protein